MVTEKKKKTYVCAELVVMVSSLFIKLYSDHIMFLVSKLMYIFICFSCLSQIALNR